MKVLSVLLLLVFASSAAVAHQAPCNEKSHPGKCCHIDKETGREHCHKK